MTYTMGIFLAGAAAVILVMAVFQVLQYFHGRQLISGSQLALRILMALIVLAVTTGVFIGGYYFSDVEHVRGRELLFVVYWSLLLIATFVLALLALKDYHLVQQARHRAQAKLYQQMAELQETLAQERRRRQQADDNQQVAHDQ